MDHQNASFSQALTYQAYLLRIWREMPGGRWRITLEDPHSNEHYAFSGVEVFIQFLMEMTETEDQQEDDKHSANTGDQKR
jgi:hypothetical protein